MSRLLSVVRRRRRDERGVVAIFTVMCMGGFLFASAAVAVDVSRWYLEAQRVQKAADAGALGAVSYMPQDLPSATTTANAITARNGYDAAADSTVFVGVAQGSKSSQLKVTVCSTITNTFGGMFGIPTTQICRYAVADYTGPAPMGSPCNTFGNEPSSGSTSAATVNGSTGTARGTSPSANCPQAPQFWATVEGPNTDKAQGDRFGNTGCSTGTAIDGCSAGTSNNNTEYDAGGYFWLIRVQPAAVGSTIDLQLYDPEFAYQSTKCADMLTYSSNTPNPYVTDATTRYGAAAFAASPASMCAGDYFPGSNTHVQMTTSFALRQQSDSGNPRKAPVQTSTSSSPCIRQYTGQQTAPTQATGDLTSSSGAYDQQLASVFHNWTSLCSFVPARAGDYYLQVRTNVSASGSSPTQTNGQPNIIFNGNTNVLADAGNTTAGVGVNSFGIRAVTPTGKEKTVSVSGYDRMPIFANADSATSTFNLIRVLPGAAGKSIAFSYFDVGDGSGGGGSVTVVKPSDSTGSITTTPFPRGGCKATGGYAGSGTATLTNCSAPFTGGSSGSNNGHTETIFIPIPDDYSCSYNDPAGCWYQVKVAFSAGTTVTDVTTWTANITGDPIRLIE